MNTAPTTATNVARVGDERVAELIAAYRDPHVSAARALCDRHLADALAYTVVHPDLSATRLTYGQLRAASERFAAALAGLGVPSPSATTCPAQSIPC